MFKKLQNHYQNSKYGKLKYRVLEIYDSLNREEQHKFVEYMAEFISEATFYRYIKCRIYNVDGTLNQQDIPFSVLYIFARHLGFENPADLMTDEYKLLSKDIIVMPRFDASFTNGLVQRHNIHVPKVVNA